MFHKTLFNKQDPQVKALQSILSRYENLAASDPSVLRLLIPSSEIWRYFVDGKDQTRLKDWVAYESREPGYLKPLCAAFDTLFGVHKDRALSTDFIKELHYQATQRVANLLYNEPDFTLGSAPGEFRNNLTPLVYNNLVIGLNLSRGGLREILQNDRTCQFLILVVRRVHAEGCNLKLNPKNIGILRRLAQAASQFSKAEREMKYDESIRAFACERLSEVYITTALLSALKVIGRSDENNLACRLYSLIMKNQEYIHLRMRTQKPAGWLDLSDYLHKQVDAYIRTYEIQIQQTSPLRKLYAIAQLIQSCERLHPAADGNTRTLSMLLLNQQLMKHGFPLAMHFNPNIYVGHSLRQMVGHLIQGMEATLKLVQGKQVFSSRREASAFTADDHLKHYMEGITQYEEEKRERPAKRQRMGA